MDHSHYRYSALPGRPSGPAGPGVQAYVLLCLEHWQAEPAPGAVRDPRFVGEFGSFTPDYRSWTQREYGLRVGVFRVIEALQAAGLRPAVAANAQVLHRVPELLRLLSDWGCEWVGHGLAANDLMHGGMPLDEQRRHVTQSLQALQAATGQRPLGWLSQDWGTTPDTFALMAEAGLSYTLDWCNDEQPYFLNAPPVNAPVNAVPVNVAPLNAAAGDASSPTRPLVAVPLSPEWDDVQCQWLRNITPRDHASLALSALDRLTGECHQHGRSAVFGLALHPWVCGMSSRIGPLRQLLADLAARPGVQWASPGQIAAQHASAASS